VNRKSKVLDLLDIFLPKPPKFGEALDDPSSTVAVPAESERIAQEQSVVVEIEVRSWGAAIVAAIACANYITARECPCVPSRSDGG
jgi:hypothetical protein